MYNLVYSPMSESISMSDIVPLNIPKDVILLLFGAYRFTHTFKARLIGSGIFQRLLPSTHYPRGSKLAPANNGKMAFETTKNSDITKPKAKQTKVNA